MGSWIIRSRAPYRLSYAGGFTDLSEYYSKNGGGATLETALGIYTYATLKERKDKAIKVQQDGLDVNQEGTLDNLSRISDFYKVIIKHFSPKKGFELVINSDLGYGSGFGSSSASLVAIIGTFNEWLNLHMDQYDIAELAHKLERNELGIYAGKQDPYSSVFGGLNYIEFQEKKVVVNSMKIDESALRELQFRTVISHSGIVRKSTNTVKELIDMINKSDPKVLEHLAAAKRNSKELKERLYTGEMDEIADIIEDDWQHKRALLDTMSSRQIDGLIEFGKANGAQAGKLMGGGGGGHILFIVEEESRYKLLKALSGKGLQLYTPDFVLGGLYSWRVRN